jgi:hypothetical protein
MTNTSKLVPALLFCTACGLGGCYSSDEAHEVVSSHAYKGHENDFDMNRFVNAYRDTLGTRLDDCQTCHTGGTFSYVSGDRTRREEPAISASSIPTRLSSRRQPRLPRRSMLTAGLPERGRNRAAPAPCHSDSDGDGMTDADEIHDLRYG